MGDPFKKVVLFADEPFQRLAQQVYRKLKTYAEAVGPEIPGGLRPYNANDLQIKRFKNGEICPEATTTLRGRDVFVIKSCVTETDRGIVYDPNTSLLEACFIGNMCQEAEADKIVLVAPHVPYLRQDRRSHDKISGYEKREPISAKLVARMIEAAGYSGLVTLDPHFQQFRGFTPRNLRVETPTARIALTNYFTSLGLDPQTTAIFSPDFGGGERAEIASRDFGYKFGGLCRKRRPKAGEIMDVTVYSEEGIDLKEIKTAIIFDDIVDSGKTQVSCAKALRERGIEKVYAAATHGILSNGAEQRLEDAGIDLVISNAIPRQQERRHIHKVDISTILAVTIHCMTTGHGSISGDLFDTAKYKKLEERLSAN